MTHMQANAYRNRRLSVCLAVAVALVTGCGTTPPYTGVGAHPQIERGARVPPVDFVGNVLALPFKILLLSWSFSNHAISPETEQVLIDYLAARDVPALADAKFRLNQYRPAQDLARLFKNPHVAWPYRLLLGLPVTLVFDVLLPGRLLPWGDYYNPYTNTVHLYSNRPAIALHEAGHVYDFGTKRYQGTYALAYQIPFVSLYHEFKASEEAVRYIDETRTPEDKRKAYHILYPAYGSYVGGAIFPLIGTVAGIIVGHILGRFHASVVTDDANTTAQSAPRSATP